MSRSRTVAAPRPNRVGHVVPHAEQTDTELNPASGSVVSSSSQRSMRSLSVSRSMWIANVRPSDPVGAERTGTTHVSPLGSRVCVSKSNLSTRIWSRSDSARPSAPLLEPGRQAEGRAAKDLRWVPLYNVEFDTSPTCNWGVHAVYAEHDEPDAIRQDETGYEFVGRLEPISSDDRKDGVFYLRIAGGLTMFDAENLPADTTGGRAVRVRQQSLDVYPYDGPWVGSASE